jgi:hypothetical protein
VNPWALLGFGVLALVVVARKRQAPSDGVTVSDEAEALGRVISSEAASYSEAERTAIAWVVRNRARKRSVTIARLVCWPTCGPCCTGRPFSSARAATSTDLALARRVLAAPASEDPTRGATAFFEPKVQDWLVAHRREGYHLTSNELRDKWQREGQRSLGSVGKFELWA